MTLDVHTLNQGLLAGTGVLLVAILAVRASSKAGLPSLLLYLLIGVGIGESGLGVHFSDAAVANALGFAALVVILAEGGLTTNWSVFRWPRLASRSASGWSRSQRTSCSR
jgi:cell volume regulation protein A